MQMMSVYYIDELDNTVYRIRNNEFESYSGNGHWCRENGLLSDYKSGLTRTLFPIKVSRAHELINAFDDPAAICRLKYTHKHKLLLRKVFGENVSLKSLQETSSVPAIKDLSTPEDRLLPYVTGEKGTALDSMLADDLIQLLNDEEVSLVMDYYETKYDFPVCNHKNCLSSNNLGYSVGITCDGIPFEAEIFEAGSEMTLSVIFPSPFAPSLTTPPDKSDSGILSFHDQFPMVDNGILDIGMADYGEEDDLGIVQKNVEFLVDRALVAFASDVCNGTVQYLVDIMGNELTKVLITLKSGDDFWAYTDLEIRPFAHVPRKKIVNFKKHQ